MARRNHFHVLIVCSQQSEFQAALDVFTLKTNCKFEGAPTDLPYNLLLCCEWNELSLNVAMVSQFESGGIESMKLVADLANHFSVGLIAMIGNFSGEGDKYGRIEYGTVIVAKRTTTESGGLERADETFEPHACYMELDNRLSSVINRLVHMGESNWVHYIPERSCCPSPLYVQELLKKFVLDNEDMTRGQFLIDAESKLLDTKTIYEVLDKMLNEGEPRICADSMFLKPTNVARFYANDQVSFPRGDCYGLAAVLHLLDL